MDNINQKVARIDTMHQAIVKIQEDIQQVKNDQKETKATIVAEKGRVLQMQMETRSSISAEVARELDNRDQRMEQRFGRFGGVHRRWDLGRLSPLARFNKI